MHIGHQSKWGAGQVVPGFVHSSLLAVLYSDYSPLSKLSLKILFIDIVFKFCFFSSKNIVCS